MCRNLQNIQICRRLLGIIGEYYDLTFKRKSDLPCADPATDRARDKIRREILNVKHEQEQVLKEVKPNPKRLKFGVNARTLSPRDMT